MNAKPILTLVVLTTVLPELFSGSTPLPSFILNPGLVLFLTLGYGVAVLLVRELLVRCGAGLGGLFVMGLGYSLFNEGVLAKTLVMAHNLPINQYDNYGYVLGLSFPWMAAIGVWHACASVLFPIMMTHRLFPEASTRPWVNGKLAVVLAAVLLALGCAGFLHPSDKGVTGTPVELVELVALMVVLFAAGAVMTGRTRGVVPTAKLWPFLFGLSVILPFWGFIFLAARKVPPAVFFAALAAVVAFYTWRLCVRDWLAWPGLALFALGWYLHNALQATLFIWALAGEPVRALATLVVDLLILVVLYRGTVRGNTTGAGAVPVNPG